MAIYLAMEHGMEISLIWMLMILTIIYLLILSYILTMILNLLSGILALVAEKGQSIGKNERLRNRCIRDLSKGILEKEKSS